MRRPGSLWSYLFGPLTVFACGASPDGTGPATTPGAGSCSSGSETDTGDSWAEFELEVVRLTNERRAEGGCCGDEGCFPSSGPLTLDRHLHDAAVAHALDMAEHSSLSHDGTSGETFSDRLARFGVTQCTRAENVAAGQATPDAVVASWMESPGHCANILWSEVSAIGVGHAESSDESGHYWAQDFGG